MPGVQWRAAAVRREEMLYIFLHIGFVVRRAIEFFLYFELNFRLFKKNVCDP